ncbi:CheR family methyltransferase [Flavobacterium subsaxonicum]|uniref:CheR family methyltransferase n=1 Tax=Flavobacterium subsaxonicum TaxID=426226 RepID=UPI00040F353A|nr:CheR family methyltransferase [Flavobacterium subsaxonicum]
MLLENYIPKKSTVNFPIVGVGASAGGLDAFSRLLSKIPENSGMAYVLVQHLAAHHESLLPEILARQTKIPVLEIVNDIELQPNTIYIIPENKILTAYDGKLNLAPRDVNGKLNKPIDIFFKSLAEVHRSFARGVVLSGTGYDGTEGLKIIKEYGGSTFAQLPDDASFEGMPLSAIRAGAADFVLTAEEIPAQLQCIDTAYEQSFAYADSTDKATDNEDELFKQIIRVLHQRTGNDFNHYKQPTMRRRIARRMVICKIDDMAAYLNLVQKDRKEQDALFNDVLIPVSYFFRDSRNFSTLVNEALPHIAKDKIPAEGIRAWVAGCSTGEEAYSMAICLKEFFGTTHPDMKIQVFASDISENVIAKARAAVYSSADVQNVSTERLNAHFSKIDGVYHVKKEIREMCVFAIHNFVKDPPFARMDLISCRNVLIYMDRFLQKKALNTFHYALRPNGVLFIGKSETINNVANLFDPLVKNQKIYSRKSVNDSFIPAPYGQQGVTATNLSHPQAKIEVAGSNIQKKVNELLFTKYTPASLILDETKDIIHFHGDTSPYLQPSQGKPNFNVYKMLHEDLAFEVRNALVKVKKGGGSELKENLPVRDKDFTVNLEVKNIEENGEQYYLLLFHKNTVIPIDPDFLSQHKSAELERIQQLEAELQQMRDDIRRVTEDQEVAYEELQSANEELLSNSEELQTLNEELETSTEELLSNNEELNSVNAELKDRQEQLSLSRMYSASIVETIREPLIVLDADLRVKSANASFYKYFKTTEQDTAGKLLFDLFDGKWHNASLKEQLLKVISSDTKVENFELEILLPQIGERVMLLNARPIINENLGEQLILIAIDDMTEIRTVNSLLEKNNIALEESNKELSSFSYIASHDLQEPLRKIHTFSKLILSDEQSKLTHESADHLTRILVSTNRMQQLTEDLLHYSHISNSDDFQLFDTDFDALIHEVIDQELSDSITAKGAVVNSAPLPVLRAMPTLIRQLFINLIGNALKYANPNIAPAITIDCTEATHSELSVMPGTRNIKYIKITVQDNGIGFSNDHAAKLFEPFFRLHSKDKYSGTGIGLAICKKIMTKHQGFITAEGTPGKGAAFSVFFPI